METATPFEIRQKSLKDGLPVPRWAGARFSIAYDRGHRHFSESGTRSGRLNRNKVKFQTLARSKTHDKIKPLFRLCKEGKLLEVQGWIAAGKPVNLPPPVKGHRRKNPLQIAIEKGFHSLVKVLLEPGASVHERTYV